MQAEQIIGVYMQPLPNSRRNHVNHFGIDEIKRDEGGA